MDSLRDLVTRVEEAVFSEENRKKQKNDSNVTLIVAIDRSLKNSIRAMKNGLIGVSNWSDLTLKVC